MNDERLRQELEVAQAVISDLQQDNTAYLRGLQDGYKKGIAHSAGVVERAAVDTVEGEQLRDALSQRLRFSASSCTPKVFVEPGAIVLKADRLAVEVDEQCRGRVTLDGALVRYADFHLYLRPGQPANVELSFKLDPTPGQGSALAAESVLPPDDLSLVEEYV